MIHIPSQCFSVSLSPLYAETTPGHEAPPPPWVRIRHPSIPTAPGGTCQWRRSIWYPCLLAIVCVCVCLHLRFQHSKEKQNYSTYPITLSMLRNRILASIEKNIFLLVCPKLECNKTQTFQPRRKKTLRKGKESQEQITYCYRIQYCKVLFFSFPYATFLMSVWALCAETINHRKLLTLWNCFSDIQSLPSRRCLKNKNLQSL